MLKFWSIFPTIKTITATQYCILEYFKHYSERWKVMIIIISITQRYCKLPIFGFFCALIQWLVQGRIVALPCTLPETTIWSVIYRRSELIQLPLKNSAMFLAPFFFFTLLPTPSVKCCKNVKKKETNLDWFKCEVATLSCLTTVCPPGASCLRLTTRPLYDGQLFRKVMLNELVYKFDVPNSLHAYIHISVLIYHYLNILISYIIFITRIAFRMI